MPQFGSYGIFRSCWNRSKTIKGDGVAWLPRQAQVLTSCFVDSNAVINSLVGYDVDVGFMQLASVYIALASD